MTTVIILSIVGAIISAVIGTLWYSNKTPMGKLHMRYLGFDKLSPDEQKRKIEEAKPTMKKVYSAQMLLSFITSLWVVFVVIMSMRNGVTVVAAYIFVLASWLCFVVPTIGTALLWGNCDPKIVWKKFFYDISYNLVNLLVIAVVASWFA